MTATAAGRQTGIRDWFVNPAEGRLRAGWRITAFLLLFFLLAASGQVGLRALLGSFPKGSPLVFPVLAVAATLAVLFARRVLDRRSFASLGLTRPRRAVLDVGFGFLLSGMMALAMFGMLAASGLLADVTFAFDAGALPGIVLYPLALTVLIGYWEELVFRGYLLQNMADGMGLRLAVIVSCLLYGLVHAGNPNATLVSTLVIVGFGWLRIYGYLATGLLWLSMGMHIGWNFFQHSVFGFAASGHSMGSTLISHRPTGPGWLTGGAFGPEGSVLMLPVLAMALVAMRAWAQRHGNPDSSRDGLPGRRPGPAA